MATPDIPAGSVMDASAALMNDSDKQVYTYEKQISYLNIALRELRELLELGNVAVTNKTSAVLTSIPAGATEVSFLTTPSLPSDLIDIQAVWERQTGIDPFIQMRKVEFIPHYLEGVEYQQFMIWEWTGQAIKLLPSVQPNDLKLDYIQQLFNTIVDENSNINLINGQSFLQFRTAGLLAEFVEENEARAQSLNTDAQLSIDRLLGIDHKSRQGITTRRRPFRFAWKKRVNW